MVFFSIKTSVLSMQIVNFFPPAAGFNVIILVLIDSPNYSRWGSGENMIILVSRAVYDAYTARKNDFSLSRTRPSANNPARPRA